MSENTKLMSIEINQSILVCKVSAYYTTYPCHGVLWGNKKRFPDVIFRLCKLFKLSNSLGFVYPGASLSRFKQS